MKVMLRTSITLVFGEGQRLVSRSSCFLLESFTWLCWQKVKFMCPVSLPTERHCVREDSSGVGTWHKWSQWPPLTEIMNFKKFTVVYWASFCLTQYYNLCWVQKIKFLSCEIRILPPRLLLLGVCQLGWLLHSPPAMPLPGRITMMDVKVLWACIA
jgi:hypothetical protein